MPYDVPEPIQDVTTFKEKVSRLKEETVVDTGLIATIKKTGGTDQIRPLAESGAAAFKMSTFETHPQRFPRIPDNEIIKAFEEIRETGLRVGFHAENDDLIFPMVDAFRQSGQVDPRSHAESRPPVTETSAVLKLLEFAYWTGVHLHIFHVTHPRCIDWIRTYQEEGVNVTAETCHNYLLLDTDDLAELGPYAKINPPLRDKASVERMWTHVQDENIDLLSSDHAPWPEEKKTAGLDNIFKSASGTPSIQILVPLLYDAAVAKGKVTPVQFARLMSQHPAEAFGLSGKGKIEEGYDADITVIDPEREQQVDAHRFHSVAKWSPFQGRTLQGEVIQTLLRGEVVYDGQEICVEKGFGSFLPGKAAT